MSSDFGLSRKTTERALLYTALAFRVAGTADLITWLPVDLEPRWASPALMALLAVESVAVFLVYGRRGAIGPRRLVVGDLLFIIAVMIADVALTGDAEAHEWGYWIRNFAMSSLVGIAIGLRSWWAALFATAAVAGTYWMNMSLVGAHDEYPYYRTMSFLFDGVGGYAVARFLRPHAVAMDAAHLRAVVSEAELTRERDRSARAAVLHDRILQTLEVLAVGNAVTDPELRGNVAASANWLRMFVQDDHDESSGGLSSALCDVIGDVTRLHGLKVDFHGGQLRTADATPEIVTAIAGSVREALTNVAKHSHTDQAVVHCEIDDDQLLVSVVDQGHGFRIADRHEGTGLRRSICNRIAAVGGHTRIHSAPGAGTQVEIHVPLASVSQIRTATIDPLEVAETSKAPPV